MAGYIGKSQSQVILDITDGSVGTADIADSAVTAAKLADTYLTTETFTELSDDTTPQLGGELDTNGNPINDTNGVDLQHNGSTKLSTTSSGVSVTGTVTATSFSGDGSSLTGVGGSTTFGAVGTYGFFVKKNAGAIAVGSTVAGSDLMYGTQSATDRLTISNDINQGTDFRSYGQSGASSPSGTWRNMGSGYAQSSNSSDTSGRKGWNLYVRTA